MTNKSLTTQQADAPLARRDTEERPLRRIAPPCDIYENADEFLILADLPGVKQDGVQVRYERGRIDLEARRFADEPSARLVAGQDLAAQYLRSFSVPGTIDVDKISAELKNGVLHLRLPKNETAKPRQIRVQTA